jgi:hypothetical protein
MQHIPKVPRREMVNDRPNENPSSLPRNQRVYTSINQCNTMCRSALHRSNAVLQHTHTHIQELQTEQQPSSQSRCQIAIVQQASTQMMEQLQLAVRRMSTTTSTVAMLLDSNPTSVQATNNNINIAIQHNAMAPIDDHTYLYQYDRSMHHQ